MLELGIINFSAFLVAAVLLNLTPGVDTLYVLGRSMTGGTRVGIASALGISTGLIVHTILAAFGLSVVLMSSTWLFWVIKALGACYLIFLGIKTFINKDALQLDSHEDTESDQGSKRLGRVYVQGIITNTLNPKIALFFLAFLPQFVDASVAFGPIPFLILGLCFIGTSTVWSTILALAAGQFKRLLDKYPRIAAYANRVTGTLYMLLGVSIFATPVPDF